MPDCRDFVDLICTLEDADPRRGIVLIDARFEERFHPWRDVFRRALALARQFEAQGVRAGQRVIMPLATDIDTIASFLALVRIGAVPFSVTAPLMGQDREAHRRQMVRLVTAHRVDRLLVSDDLAGIAGAYPETPAEMALTARRPTDEELADDTPVPRPGIDPAGTVFVQFSSGSTSHPKGVRITHRGLLHNLAIIARNDRRTPDSVMVSWLPLYHDMGLVGCLLSNLVHQNMLVLMHPRCFLVRPLSWLNAVSRHRGTVTAVPNFALDLCSDRISDEQLDGADLDLSTFRYIYDGSEPVRVASIRRFEERFARFGFVRGSVYPVYGMAECTLIATAPAFDEPVVHRHVDGMDVPSVGWPLGDFELQVRGDDGRALGPGQTGEIWLHGTSVTPGYLDPAATAELIKDGWLATGDLGTRDDAGRVYITGRRKDLIIVQGRNFYGHDIAACVEERLGLRAGGAYAFAVERDGQEAVVVMVASGKSNGDAAHVEGAVDDAVKRCVLAEFGLPVHDVLLVAKLPRTTSGKIVRHLCREMYESARV